jgi:hypothetical protein
MALFVIAGVVETDFPFSVSVAYRIVIYRRCCAIPINDSAALGIVVLVNDATRGLIPWCRDTCDIEK